MFIAESAFLRWLVGSNPDAAGEPKLHWANLPESWGVFVLVGAIALVAFAVFWMYRREINTCPMHIKILMGIMRLSVLLLLIALLLKPSVFYQEVDEIKPVIALLRDASLSFNRGDQYQDEEFVSRLATVSGLPARKIAGGEIFRNELLDKALAQKNQAIVDALRDKGSIRVVDFSDSLEPVAVLPASVEKATDAANRNFFRTLIFDKVTTALAVSNQDPSLLAENVDPDENTKLMDIDRDLIQDSIPPLESNGLGSDIAQALRETLSTTRLSAIILASDGQNTTSEDPAEIAQLALEKNIPIYVIGVGDANPPRNLAVKKIFRPEVAFPDEQFEISAQVQALSLGEEQELPGSIEVGLMQHKINPQTGKTEGAPVDLGTKVVQIPADRRTFKVAFSHTMNVPGEYSFSVHLPTLENEIKTDDNQLLSSPVQVADKKYKVLLISGLPNWDYQQVQRFLQRDQTVTLSCWLQSMDESRVQEGNEPIAYLPRTIQELGEYNVIIMIDPDPTEFNESFINLLKDFCKIKAGGILYMAGPHFTTEFVTMNRLKGIREVLPVRFGDLEYIGVSQDLAEAKADGAGKMLVVPSKLEHPVMSFNADREESAIIWSQLPNILWNFPTLAAKPTAEVLLERGDNVNEEGNQPLLVTGRYGAGTVLYFGFQGTWRWRSVGLQAEHFDDFWMLVVRHLFQNNSMQGASRGMIETDRTNFELGEKISLYVEVRDDQLKGLTQPTLTGIVTDDSGRKQQIVLQREPGQDEPDMNEGRYSGSYSATRLGTFEIGVDIGPDSEKLVAPVTVNVVPPSVEANKFWLNEKKLRGIATQSGGKYFSLDEIEDMPVELPRIVTRAEFNSPSQPIWDLSNLARYLAFLLPVVLLGCEWALRKWHKLL